MAEIIQDGTGKAFAAKVDAKHRLHTDSVSATREETQSQRGFSFNINTGNITLTNSSVANGVLYVKNNEDYNLVLSNLFYNIGASTGGSGNVFVDIISNPTTGTLISGAVAVDIVSNRNFGSSRTLNVTAYKGATGTTVTNGNDVIKSILTSSSQRVAIGAGAITLPKGSSIAIVFTTPASNTSVITNFAIACFLEDELDNL